MTITDPNFETPIGLAVDTNGKIYVTDYGNGSLRTFSATGAPTTPTILGLTNPYGVTVDAAGNIYVAGGYTATSSGNVTAYRANGTPTGLKITQGLDSPSGITIH